MAKTKNQFYEMRSALAQLQFNIIRYVPHPVDNGESKVFMSKRLGQHVIDTHRSRRSVVRGERTDRTRVRWLSRSPLQTTHASLNTLTSAITPGCGGTRCLLPKDVSLPGDSSISGPRRFIHFS